MENPTATAAPSDANEMPELPLAVPHTNEDLLRMKVLELRSDSFGRTFAFRRLKIRDQEPLSVRYFDLAGGQPKKMSDLSAEILFGVALFSLVCENLDLGDGNGPFDFLDQEDESEVLRLLAQYNAWRSLFLKGFKQGLGAFSPPQQQVG